jgi:cytochrome d ubiquinol oxidase subunit II
MTLSTVQIIVFSLIGFSWMVYLVQEMFITGASALNKVISANEGERKQVQVCVGIHWDGIEVWLLASLLLTYAAFPVQFTTILSHLYVPFYLLLFAIMARGVAIEMVYKLDSERWVKNLVWMWTISSVLIITILGVYMTNLFVGFPLTENGLEGGFFSIFNTTGISGGLFFLALALVAGAGWISLTTEGDLGAKALVFVQKYGIIYVAPIVLLLTYMGINNYDSSLFIGELFTASPVLFILPALTVITSLLVMYFGFKKNGLYVFITSLMSMAFYIITGFVGSFPNVVTSRSDVTLSMTIEQSVGIGSMNIILIAIFILYPIVIGYQVWKYKTFTKKVKFNDE